MKQKESSIKKNISKYYWFSFIRELMFIMPVIYIFWQSNGLNLTQIMLLQSIFAIGIVFLEVPTGVIADKVGRKQSLICGTIASLMGYLVYSFGTTFAHFAIAEIILAAGLTFVSGADAAFVYDSLKQEKKEKNYKKVWGNAKSIDYSSQMLSAIVGSAIAVYSLRAGWYMISVAMFIAMLIAFTFKEPKHYKKLKETSYLKHTLESFKKVGTNKNLLFLVLFHATLAVVLKISLWFYQPYMLKAGIPMLYFGIAWASLNIFSIAGSKLAHRVEGFLGVNRSLWLIILLSTLSLAFMSYWIVLFGMIFIFAQQFARGFAPPVVLDYTNKHLSSEKRATLLSIQSFAGGLSFAIFAPLYGWIADAYSLSTALIATAASFLVIFIILMIWKKTLDKKKGG